MLTTPEMGPSFRAKYDGTCRWCGTPWKAGDLIAKTPLGYVCEGCGINFRLAAEHQAVHQRLAHWEEPQ